MLITVNVESGNCSHADAVLLVCVQGRSDTTLLDDVIIPVTNISPNCRFDRYSIDYQFLMNNVI